MPVTLVSALLFGKLPAQGDFVARGLSAGQRDVWDQWLADEMERANAVHGDAFAQRFDAAPVWCFSAADGEDGWLSGALAPSVDSVGRRFPLLAAVQAPGYAEACGELLYRALTEDWDASRFHAALAGEEAKGADAGDAGWWLPDAAGVAGTALAGLRPQGLIAAMMAPREAAA